MKRSEARVLLYLDVVDKMYTFGRAISFKLNMDYGYLNRILSDMKMKGWIGCIPRSNKKFYHLLKKANLKTARKIIAK